MGITGGLWECSICFLLGNHKKVYYGGLSAIFPMMLQECPAYKMKSSEMKKNVLSVAFLTSHLSFPWTNFDLIFCYPIVYLFYTTSLPN